MCSKSNGHDGSKYKTLKNLIYLKCIYKDSLIRLDSFFWTLCSLILKKKKALFSFSRRKALILFFGIFQSNKLLIQFSKKIKFYNNNRDVFHLLQSNCSNLLYIYYIKKIAQWLILGIR